MKREKFKIWFQAARAETLIVSICPITIGAFLAHREIKLNVIVLVLSYIYGLLVHLGTNLSNDYFDYIKGADTDKRIAPLSTIQKKTTSLDQIKTAYLISFIAAFIIGILLILRGGMLIALLFTLPIISGYFYTGGKHPLGYIGLGEILVLLFFGPFAVWGTYYLQTLKLSFTPFLLGFGPGFLIAAVIIINNIRDMVTDKEANKNTLAVKFGKKFAQIEYFICVFLAFITPLIFFNFSQKPIILCSSVFIFFVPFKLIMNFKTPSLLNDGLKKTVLLSIIYTAFFCIALI
ncbi:MAG: 1,4-dihydroxy-2-naphthoate octaprenyltransferase [Parachlamydiales bacterium]|jgi:1,4-dihydroxy-2-naphthoate octaprenyltransferase